MANYSNLKAAIAAAIKQNGNQEITGQVLQDVLTSMVSVIGANYTFAGVATPATNPGTPDQNLTYLAMEGGTYTNFNGMVLPAGISLLMWNGTWTSETVMYGDGGVFDISVYKSSGGTLATFSDLSAALDGGNNIPASARKGGMSVKFVQSSDNKYVQWRYMGTAVTGTPNPFLDIANWQGVDEEPTAGSSNIPSSGGVEKYVNERVSYEKINNFEEYIVIKESNNKLIEITPEKTEINNNVEITPETQDDSQILIQDNDQELIVINRGKTIINNDLYVSGNLYFTKQFNKMITLEGDSITYGYNPAGARFTYYQGQLVNKLPGVTITNLGVSSSTVTNHPPQPQMSSQQRMTAVINSAPDIILLLAGVNDYGVSAPLGDISDTVDTTFSGALKTMIETYLQALPNVRLIYCTPTPYYYHFVGQSAYHSGRTPNAEGHTLRDYADRAIEICKLYAIPVVDTNHDAGWLDINEVEGHFNFTSDGIHLSEKGYNVLTDLEVSKIKFLFNLNF